MNRESNFAQSLTAGEVRAFTLVTGEMKVLAKHTARYYVEHEQTRNEQFKEISEECSVSPVESLHRRMFAHEPKALEL